VDIRTFGCKKTLEFSKFMGVQGWRDQLSRNFMRTSFMGGPLFNNDDMQ